MTDAGLTVLQPDVAKRGGVTGALDLAATCLQAQCFAHILWGSCLRYRI